jgi:hypothetical protein
MLGGSESSYLSILTETLKMTVSPLLYDGVVYIPTSYIVERDGYFFEGTPIESVPAEQTERLRWAILAAINRGNPPISRAEVIACRGQKNSPMLAATGARSWFVLDRQLKGSWSLVERDGRYQIRVDQPMRTHGWNEDKKEGSLPAGNAAPRRD